MRRTLPIALLTFLFAGCGGAQLRAGGRPFHAADLFPLTTGSAWSYDIDNGAGPMLAVTRVVEVRGRRAVLTNGGGELVYERRDDGVYRPREHVYLLRDPLRVGSEWESTGGRRARIAAVERRITTAAGRFDGCVVVEERGGVDGRVITTTYAPGVGVVRLQARLETSAGVQESTAALRGFVVR